MYAFALISYKMVVTLATMQQLATQLLLHSGSARRIRYARRNILSSYAVNLSNQVTNGIRKHTLQLEHYHMRYLAK